MRRSIAGAGAAVVGAATTAAVLVLGTATGLAAPGTSSAFGVSASGLIPIEPTPFVESTDGTEQNDSLVTVPLQGLGTVEVEPVMAGDDAASSKVVNAELSMGTQAIKVEVLDVECEGDTGTVAIARLTVGGEVIEIPPADQNPVNQELSPAPEVLSIVYNQQTQNEDGTFTVNGLVIDVVEGTQTITLGSATCGGPATNGDDDDDDAPKPTPIETELPVTG